MKTQEELNALKNEYESLNKKLLELSDEELELVSGGQMYLRLDETKVIRISDD